MNDGTVAFFDGPGSPYWTTSSAGSGAYLVVQADGNLVAYGPGGAILFRSGVYNSHC